MWQNGKGLKMNKKKKVLIVTQRFEYGGLDFVAIRLQQALDADKYEFTYCIRSYEKINDLEDRIKATGVRVLHHPDNAKGYLGSYRFYVELFKKEHFDIVHCHLPFYSGLVMAAAKKSNVKKRISHSHYSHSIFLEHSKLKYFASEIYRMIMRQIIGAYSTNVIACSKEAGWFLCGKRFFRKKGTILNNCIDTEKYIFDLNKRCKLRKLFEVENKIVIGHIGQMYYVKNQSFLLDIFYEFQKKHPDSILMLLGDGSDKNMLKQKTAALGLTDKVKFLGFRDDVADIMNVMDCLVFPSLHEGFPLTLIEAQATKLPCVVSDTIISDVKLNDNVLFANINASPDQWCIDIEKLLRFDRNKINNELIYKFDIKNISNELEKIYSN